jgi:hypothetical protein
MKSWYDRAYCFMYPKEPGRTAFQVQMPTITYTRTYFTCFRIQATNRGIESQRFWRFLLQLRIIGFVFFIHRLRVLNKWKSECFGNRNYFHLQASGGRHNVLGGLKRANLSHWRIALQRNALSFPFGDTGANASSAL